MKKGPIEEYRDLAAVCAETNFGNKLSIKRYCRAVERMNLIAEEIGYEGTGETKDDFIKLLEVEENKVKVLAAIHLLERIPIEKETEKEALKVIKKASQANKAEAIRYQVWLEEWEVNSAKLK